MRTLGLAPYFSACLSHNETEKGKADILFIDAMGELAMAYALCDVAFIGGSLVKEGGHNPLEPAMFGKPVLFGPHMTDFREIENLLLDAGGAVRVENVKGLGQAVVSLLTDTNGGDMGDAAKGVFYDNAGALKRIFQQLEGYFFV